MSDMSPQLLPVNPVDQTPIATQLQGSGAKSVIDEIQKFLTGTYHFRFNYITHRLLVRSIDSDEQYHYLDEYEFNSILKRIKTQNISCSKDTLLMILKSDYVERFDPYVSYLNDLPEWDGKDYVAYLADTVEVTQPEYWRKCLRKWLVALVASLRDQNTINQTAIVLSGPQGIGKTTWFHTILPPEFQEFIHEGYVQTKDKETSVKIAECVLVLMDELENLSDKSMDGVKQLMTQKGTALRRAYTTITQFYHRRASFAGTVNKKHFLKDLTGNRRFLCFDVSKIDLQHHVPMKQLYAQLVHLHDSGFQFWFDEDEIAELNMMNAEFRDISVEEEAFVNHFEKCSVDDEDAIFLTTTQIRQKLVQKTGYSCLSIQALGHVLRDTKVERLKRSGVYGYIVKAKS